MDLALYQVDAFADAVFTCNPAAVVPLKTWLPDEMLRSIAAENNLAETAYFIPHEDGAAGHYHLRWFTPGAEVDLCGHATLASAFVLFEYLAEKADRLTFETRSGPLLVTRAEAGHLSMDFPANVTTDRFADGALLATFENALGTQIAEPLMRPPYSLFVLPGEADVRGVTYTGRIADALDESPFWGLLITALANEGRPYDFVSRFFAPGKGVPEDSVTGSAHCMLAPYWADVLGKDALVGFQASPRGGFVHSRVKGDRVTLSGSVAPYLKGTITI